jgi:hypothetical protein
MKTLYVNGEYVDVIHFFPAFPNLRYFTGDVALKAGANNTLTLQQDAADAGDILIDAFTLTAQPPVKK